MDLEGNIRFSHSLKCYVTLALKVEEQAPLFCARNSYFRAGDTLAILMAITAPQSHIGFCGQVHNLLSWVLLFSVSVVLS